MILESLTLEDIAAVVDGLKQWGNADPEAAHSREDDLHQSVLEYIASGQCPDPAAFAQAALQTRDIRFPRWCA